MTKPQLSEIEEATRIRLNPDQRNTQLRRFRTLMEQLFATGSDALKDAGHLLVPLFDILGGTYHRPDDDEYDATGGEECKSAGERWRPIIW